MDTYDVVIIGSGPGGYVAAVRAAQLGQKTCLVERHATLGGTCLNVGCIPSKALLESSEIYHLVKEQLPQHGIGTSALSLDLPAMQLRKEGIVRELTDGIAGLMQKNKVTVLRGHGRLAGPGRVDVLAAGDESATELSARAVILATGSRSVELPFLPRDRQVVLDSTDALALQQVPEHLVVVGAGAVGLELGSVWMRLGSQVTVVEMLPQIAPFADRAMAKVLQRSLAARGMTFLLKTRVSEARISGGRATLTLERQGAEPQTVTCDHVLVAVGRRPCTEELGLEQAGVALTQGGHVQVDDKLRTSVEGIYAIGDLVPGPALAHKAEEEGVAAAELIAGKPGQLNHQTIPSVIYTNPELAMVGLTEQQARERGQEVRTGRFLFRANGRAKALGQTEGQVKILADAHTDRLLGVHMVGPHVSELIAEVVVAMEFSASAEDLARTIHAHPTLSEVVKEAALAVDKRAIHG